eukprot:TRINITY_DN17841_c0_g1_i1.p1 TRINITY_DN17841_c0_g1~~TRINITY_DN17841_c0_g1_i1.p1  ORF type:complete len:447 (-),score=109.91 TRINITY_DN17841_c0_g1_i1:390-1730(-)
MPTADLLFDPQPRCQNPTAASKARTTTPRAASLPRANQPSLSQKQPQQHAARSRSTFTTRTQQLRHHQLQHQQKRLQHRQHNQLAPASAEKLPDRATSRAAKAAAWELQKRADFRFKRGNFGGAVQDYKAVLSKRAESPGILLSLAAAFHETGDPRAAIEACNRSLKLRRSACALISRAASKRRLGDANGAVQDCTDALRLDPRSIKALINRSAARCELDDLNGAWQDCDKVLDMSPWNVEALVNRAVIRCAAGDLSGAIRDCSGALEVSPDHCAALMNRSVAKERQGDLSGACSDLELAAKSGDPRALVALFETKRRLGTKRDEDVKAVEEQVGVVMEQQQRQQQQQQQQQQKQKSTSLRHRTGDSRVHERTAAVEELARVKLRDGDIQGAVEAFETALEIEPDSSPALSGRGRTKHLQKEYESAIDDLFAAIDVEVALAENKLR